MSGTPNDNGSSDDREISEESGGLRAPRGSEFRDIVQAASLIEQLELDRDRMADHSRIRRILEQAAQVWDGPPESQWWRWILEARDNLGLKCHVIDCSISSIQDLTQAGGRVLIRLPATGEWCAISRAKGSKVLVLRPEGKGPQQWMSASQLTRFLNVTEPNEPVRCVVIALQLFGSLSADKEEHHQSPLARLWALLKPEAADIWVVILFALLVGILSMATPLAIEALVSSVTFGRFLQPVIVLSLMLLAFLSFQAAIRGLQTFVVELIQRRLFARVAADISYSLPRVRYESVYDHSGRELVNRFFEVVTVQKVSSQLLMDGISTALNTLIGMLVLGFYHPWLLGFDVVLLALIAFAILVLGRGAVNTSIIESKWKYRLVSWLEDLAGCVGTFRQNGAAEFAIERSNRFTYEYLAARQRHFRILIRQILFSFGLQAIASTVLLGLGGWLVISGQLTLGQLVAAELIVTVIVSSFAKLGKHMESYYDIMASMDKLGHLFDLPLERQSGLLVWNPERPTSVTLKDVEYAFPEGRVALAGVSLTVPAGARAVLTGRSGSGKSILLDLLFALRKPAAGRVLLEDVDPQELHPDTLRRHVALIRNIEVFEGTIAENVHLERQNVTDNDVREALQTVGLLEELRSLPDGLETELNCTGYPLTSNQLRKLMLAKGIITRPRLLLIDGMLDGLPDQDGIELMHKLCDENAPWTLILITGRNALAEMGTFVLDLSEQQESNDE